MLNYIEYLNEVLSHIGYFKVPTIIIAIIVGILLILQIIGEIMEVKGKVAPEFMKIRKYFSRKKQENNERVQTLKDVQVLLKDVNAHYSVDNIAKRDGWMQWVNDRAVKYDDSIVEISSKIDAIVQALNGNTKMTEEMFVQSSRDRIIDFATKVADKNAVVSREEFNRIFKVYDKYEKFLEEHDMTNGEVDIAMDIIKQSYGQHIKYHTFIEDTRNNI